MLRCDGVIYHCLDFGYSDEDRPAPHPLYKYPYFDQHPQINLSAVDDQPHTHSLFTRLSLVIDSTEHTVITLQCCPSEGYTVSGIKSLVSFKLSANTRTCLSHYNRRWTIKERNYPVRYKYLGLSCFTLSRRLNKYSRMCRFNFYVVRYPVAEQLRFVTI